MNDVKETGMVSRDSRQPPCTGRETLPGGQVAAV